MGALRGAFSYYYNDMNFFDRLSDKLGAFFSKGPVFAFWVGGTIIWLAFFPWVSKNLAQSAFADRLNFHQLIWLTIINIFTLFYCIWISNNQIRNNKATDKKFDMLADALAKHMEASAESLNPEQAGTLRDAAAELRDSIGKEKEVHL